MDCTNDSQGDEEDSSLEIDGYESTDNADQNLNVLNDGIIHVYRGKYGGVQLGLNGHLYTRDRTRKLKSGNLVCYWQCQKRYLKKCTGRLITTAQEPYSLIKEPAHCHEEDVLNLKVAGLKTKVMSVALSSNEPPSSVIRRTFMDADNETIAQCPSADQLKRSVRVIRKKMKVHPVTPKSAHFTIQEHYKRDCKNRTFLLAGKC